MPRSSCSGSPAARWLLGGHLRASFSGEALHHTMFSGLVGAGLVGLPLMAGGALGLLVGAAAIALAARTAALGRDTPVAVVFPTLFGLGAWLSLAPASRPASRRSCSATILGVAGSDLAAGAVLGTVTLLALPLLHTRLLAVGLDRLSARSLGAPPVLADLGLLVLVALATLVAVQALGNLFGGAVLVAPAAAARHLAQRATRIMVLGAGIALAAGVAGLYGSYYLHTAAGASIAARLVAAHLIARGAAVLRDRPAPTLDAR